MFEPLRPRTRLVPAVLVLSVATACERPADETPVPMPGTAPPRAVESAAVPDEATAVSTTATSPEEAAVVITSNAGTWLVTYELLQAGPVPLNEPFGLSVVVSSAAGGGRPADGVELIVDAGMPEHEHGMNTRTIVTRDAESGRFEVDGLLFHMPGRWELYFDVVRDGVIERAQDEIVLE